MGGHDPCKWKAVSMVGSMTPEPMVIWNHGYRGMERLDQKVVPSTGHKPGQISSKKYFSTIFRTRILRSFFWKGSRVARKPGLYQKLKKNYKKRRSKNAKKSVLGTKWVGIGRNQEISIRIDAPRSGDLENRGFGQSFGFF